MRILVAAQIHGYLDEFQELLKSANYDSTQDKLILLGDYLNKGKKQKELIDYLMELQEKGAIILCGQYEDKYIDALVNDDSIAEQSITSENNIYYDYLDNIDLRKKQIQFLVSLKDSYSINNMHFSYDKIKDSNSQSFYCLNDSSNIDDFLEENNYLGLNFFKKSIGLIDVINRRVYKINI